METIIYAVEGSGTFPVDMLRYDQAFPAKESDSALISQQRDRRVVELVHFQPGTRWEPAGRRWESFGWRLVGKVRRFPQ